MFDSDDQTPSRDLEPSNPVLNSLDCPPQGPIHHVNHYTKQYASEPIYDLTLHDLPVSVKFGLKSFEKKIPKWLMSSEEHFRSILSNLAAPILFAASSACIPRIPMPNTQRKKESYVSNILSDFMAQRSSLLSISDEDFKSWSSKSAETPGKNKYQVFAYHMQGLYGNIIGSAFRELPHKMKVPPDFTTLAKYFKEDSWVNETLQILIERSEKAFKTADIVSSI